MGYFKTCPRCGAHLDPGERCVCNREGEIRNYTETETFRKEVERLKAAGISGEAIEKYTAIHSQFDENGMDVGTDYGNMILAFPHPVP